MAPDPLVWSMSRRSSIAADEADGIWLLFRRLFDTAVIETERRRHTAPYPLFEAPSRGIRLQDTRPKDSWMNEAWNVDLPESARIAFIRLSRALFELWRRAINKPPILVDRRLSPATGNLERQPKPILVRTRERIACDVAEFV